MGANIVGGLLVARELPEPTECGDHRGHEWRGARESLSFQQRRDTLGRLLVQEHCETHRFREPGLVGNGKLDSPANGIDVRSDVNRNEMTKIGSDQRAVSSRSRATGTFAPAGTDPLTQMR